MGKSDEQEQGELRVVDKRRFNAAGDSRDEQAPPVVGSTAERDAPRVAESRDAVKPKQTHQQAAPAETTAEEKLPPVDFSSFIVSLATQALVMLGEIPNPESNTRIFHREAAQHTIDIISMLEERTQGNLTADEQNLVNEVLTSLRLAFVKKVKEHDHAKTPA